MAAGAEWIMHRGELWAQLPVGFPNGQSAELQLGPHHTPREVARAFCETHKKAGRIDCVALEQQLELLRRHRVRAAPAGRASNGDKAAASWAAQRIKQGIGALVV